MSFSHGARYTVLPGAMDILAAQYTRQEFAPHFHDTFAFGVIEHGECHFLRSGIRYVARPGDLFVIHPFESHTGSPAATGLSYRVLYPSCDWLKTVFPGSGASTWPHFPSAVYCSPEAQALRHSIQLIGECSGPAPGPDQLAALSPVLAAIGQRHSTGMRRCPDPGEGDSPVSTACRLLSRTCADTSFSDVAAMLGLSRYHFHRLFRRAIGLTPGSWSRSVRLRRARGLIHAGASLADVANETGFSDQSHLTREFRRVYGVTPGTLRARQPSNPVQDEDRRR